MKIYLAIASIALFLLIGCTEEAELQIHPDGWIDIGSDNSHMAKISSSGIGSCKECHGGTEPDDYYGGIADISCFTCHASGPSGHPVWSEWMNPADSVYFHGVERIADRGIPLREDQRCAKCHDFYHKSEENTKLGSSVGIFCTDCHTRDQDDPGQKILVDCSVCH